MWETFEIRSKSFTIKWVEVPSNSKIQWDLKPLKNSIYLGIYQKPLTTKENSVGYSSSTSTSLVENLNVDEVNEIPHGFFNENNNNLNNKHHSGGSNSNLPSARTYSSASTDSNNDLTSLESKLDKQFNKINWVGKCAGGQFIKGSVDSKNGGLYAFVFDNTFSKTKAKTVIFKFEIENSNKNKSESSTPLSDDVNENKMNHHVKFDENEILKTKKKINDSTINNKRSSKIININGIQYLQGFLLKKKRRKGSAKTFTKRFFSLNLNYAILNYYSNSNTSTIRGNMMITQTVISADASENLLYLDSGVEQWTLKATNKEDFKNWIHAFNFIKFQYKKNNDLKKISNNQIHTAIDDLLSNNEQTYEDDTASSDNDNEYDDFFSVKSDLSKGNKISKSTTYNPHFQTVELKIEELKEMVEKLIVEEDSNNDVEEIEKLPPHPQLKNSVGNSSSGKTPRRGSKPLSLDIPTNNASSTPLMRKPSFLSRLKKRSSNSVPSTPIDRRSFDIENTNNSNTTINNNNNNNNYNDYSIEEEKSSPLVPPAETVRSQACSVSSLNSSPVIGTILETRKDSLKTVLEKIKELELEYFELLRSDNDMHRSESRKSLTRTNTQAKSLLSQEFYDAQEYVDETSHGVVMLSNDSDEQLVDDSKEQTELSYNIFQKDLQMTANEVLTTSSDESESEDNEPATDDNVVIKTETAPKPEVDERDVEEDLYPLPYKGNYIPRTDIKPAACEPPSLISILRKGIGKDMSSLAMPVSTNEPLSFLQKYTESLEYCNLVNDAMKSPIETGERILKISAFAISFLSSYKEKVRSTRKPFNPLLGETFELIRPDLDIRVITEKVIHKPFIMASHVDSTNWFIDHTICPQQKFYGKTAEISIDGTLKLKFRDSEETYEWNQPNTILRNIVSLTGDKYTEPVESIAVKSNKGLKCIVSFIPENGRFTSSRSEKVEFKVYHDNDKKNSKPLKLSASGSWTNEIKLNNGQIIWKIAKPIHQSDKKYGFTKFSCCLNSFDEIHNDCSPTDSRRRPDQRIYEDGKVDEADILKLKLEEDQRGRRHDSNGNPVTHKPAFFINTSSSNLDWKYIHGENSYWNRRKHGKWDGLVKLW